MPEDGFRIGDGRLVSPCGRLYMEIPKLESVDDHNARRRKENEDLQEARLKTGVACPKCGGELRWDTDPYICVSVYPPPTTAPAKCGPCGLTVELEK